MFIRTRALTLVSALCVLASASAHAAGEFEAAWRQQFFSGYLKSLKEAGGDEPGLTQRADEKADCYVRHVMQDFTPEEVARLDTWATGGKSPGKDVVARLIKRSTEVVANHLCSTEPNEPVNDAVGNDG
jgi:hypothetical protein